MTKLRTLLATIATLALVLGGLLVGGGTAQAVWNCYAWTSQPRYAYATCDYGLGGVRVWGSCWNGHYDNVYHGPWVTAGHVSSVICTGTDTIDGAWYETF